MVALPTPSRVLWARFPLRFLLALGSEPSAAGRGGRGGGRTPRPPRVVLLAPLSLALTNWVLAGHLIS